MALYSVVLFLHIVGTLGFFVALGLEWMSLLYLRRASLSKSAREWLSALAWLSRLGPPSMGIILLSGFYMMYTTWGGVAWIGMALAAMILLAVLAVAFTRPRVAAIERAVATESEILSVAFRQRLHDPILWRSIQIRVAVALGIVFLMTVKPDLGGALLTIGLAIILGWISAWSVWHRSQTNYKEYGSEIETNSYQQS